jgi:two-component system, chemotaxis family, chemotaxis protein CheY
MAYCILVVDDSPAMRRLVRRVVELSGFPVAEFLEAGNGLAALQVLERRGEVSLILTDINMPEMSGEQLVDHLSRHERYASIPVVVISTDATRHRIHRLKELGARGYITKPFQPEALRCELERALDAR